MPNGEKQAANAKLIIRLRMILLSMLVLILCVLGMYCSRLYRHCKVTQLQEHRILKFIGEIKHLDEILTMSSHMAIATGDLQWERRYRDFEPQLDDAIKEAIALSSMESMRKAANQTNLANLRLVAIENKVFNLVRQGEREKAVGLLNSREYTEQKNLYKNGMSEFTVILQNNMQNIVTKSYRMFLGVVIILAFLGSLLLFAWGAVLQMHKRFAEKEQSENNLQIERNKFASVVEAMEDGLSIRNLEYDLIYQNKVLEDIYGDCRGEKCYQIFEGRGGVCDGCPEELVCDGCPVELAFKDGKSHTSTREVIMPSGETGFWENTANPIRDASGKIIACLEINKNITERKRIEIELENYKDNVIKAQKHAYIASMGTIIAHQLNQPLTTINMRLGKALEMVEESNCSSKCFKNVKESLAEAKRAASIIQKFRQYSKDPDLETTGEVQVSDIAKMIISVSSERAKRAKINIFPKNLDDLPEAEINETALEQMLYIIIQNAIEASDGKEQHTLNILGKYADGIIELQFSDDCCGISHENLEKIFEPFFSTKSDGKGIGLGLDIVQQILISCGGEIRVKSKLGKGATFYVTLPISNNSNQ